MWSNKKAIEKQEKQNAKKNKLILGINLLILYSERAIPMYIQLNDFVLKAFILFILIKLEFFPYEYGRPFFHSADEKK